MNNKGDAFWPVLPLLYGKYRFKSEAKAKG
jgi:hypothetical protein